ncbi:MAG TPA: hypothetical protein VH951_08805, partial [Dehalococcoidia bacterium]
REAIRLAITDMTQTFAAGSSPGNAVKPPGISVAEHAGMRIDVVFTGWPAVGGSAVRHGSRPLPWRYRAIVLTPPSLLPWICRRDGIGPDPVIDVCIGHTVPI